MTRAIVNLRRHRKRKARDRTRAEADENAVRHGEAKAIRSLRVAQEVLEARRLDGHQSDDTGREPDEPR